jgi:phosphatidylserine/phosphatidylglycerophosphate/cardiolipin synthase-like enzyme
MLFISFLHLCAEKLTVMKGVVAKTSQIEILVTPKDKCFGRIVQLIDGAKETINVQAYQLTAEPIAEALKRAHARGVKVHILADKTQTSQTSSTFIPGLAAAGIPIKIDHRPAIAHCKIIIIDGKTTLTGSYNWTDGAENRNAENLVIIENQKEVAKIYQKNWDARSAVSKPYTIYMNERASKSKK